MPRRRLHWALGGAVAIVVAAVGAGYGTSGKPPVHGDVGRDVVAAVQAFDLSNGHADGDGFLAKVTDAYVANVLGPLGVTRDDVSTNPDQYLGHDPRRTIGDVTVHGDRAAVQSTVPAGLRGAAATTLSLIRRNGAWLIDDEHAGPADVPKRTHRVELGMTDFKFAVDTASFVANKPFVLHAANTGGQPHMFALWRITSDIPTIRVVEATDNPPIVEYIHSPTFRPGESGDVAVNMGVPPGRYILVCLLSDVTTPALTPHYDRGMILDFKIAAS